MIISIYAVFDSKAGAYLPPFFMHNDNLAKRAFIDCVNSDDHQFATHPDDYTLFCIGILDDNTAEITPATPQTLGNGLEFINQEPPGKIKNEATHSDELPVLQHSASGNPTKLV